MEMWDRNVQLSTASGYGKFPKSSRCWTLVVAKKAGLLAEVDVGESGEDLTDQHAPFEGSLFPSLDQIAQPNLRGKVAADDIGV
jgi:hypothetical protein